MQNCVNNIVEWSEVWQLKLAIDNCQYSHISLSTSSVPAVYFVSDSQLPTTSKIRDLGVIVDNRLTFKHHVTSIVTRAHVRVMQIWRCFLCKNMDVLMRVFITYVHPLLEYCSSVWSPSSKAVTGQLESVQRRFTKRLPGKRKRSGKNRETGARFTKHPKMILG